METTPKKLKEQPIKAAPLCDHSFYLKDLTNILFLALLAHGATLLFQTGGEGVILAEYGSLAPRSQPCLQ